MRLFIAIPLPETILNSIIKLQEPIRGIKWQKKVEQMHLTLRFLGETPQTELAGLQIELNTILMNRFTIQIEGVGVFPHQRSPRVIWAGIRKSKPLMELQQKVETRCRRSGFKPEKRSFKPHITFGRVKKASAKQVQTFIEGKKVNLLSRQFNVTHFNLYRSDLNRSGAVHSLIERYLLSG
jgi:2'-5' RNA ligase